MGSVLSFAAPHGVGKHALAHEPPALSAGGGGVMHMKAATPKAKKAVEHRLLLPAETEGWENWVLGEGEALRVAEATDLAAAVQMTSAPGRTRGLPPVELLAIPIRQVFCIPLWVSGGDSSLFPDLILAQLERRGLLGRSREETVMDYREIAREGDRALLVVRVLPMSFPAPMAVESISHYDCSVALYALPPDRMTIWREMDGLVLAITRGDQLAYFQALGDASITTPVLKELRCLQFQLQAQGVLGTQVGLTLWGQFLPAEQESISHSLMLPIESAPRPAPIWPASTGALLPLQVQAANQQRAKQAKLTQRLLIGAAVYVAAILLWAAYVGYLQLRVRSMAAQAIDEQNQVTEMKATSQKWNVILPAYETANFPLETLLHVASVLPKDGVLLTLFDQKLDKVLIEGHANTPSAAYKLKDDVAASLDLNDFNWTMDSPKVLPDNTATFRLEGSYNAPAQP